MMNYWRYGGASAVYLPLIVILLAGRSECRELRPADHGLETQSNATAITEDSPEMLSFFGGASTWTAAANMPLPEAKNMSGEASWWRQQHRSGGGWKDHWRKGLVVATVACGATGIGFLLVAALLFFFQYQKKRSGGSAK
ncbi:uncharacterized protein LOC127794641 [Diospyros lotus]|uniref:uncharacterized protein LOC127794641 n=1 Tax=Diospyros lotus TaxID=55363 RepID=UPI00224FC656|nr:uncharacterized protein LOC127794641 [Diospyros lotus]